MVVRNLLIVLALCSFASCIERYFPEEVSNVDKRIVIDGLVSNQIDGEGQRVYISESTAIDTLGFNALSGCGVQVFDSKNTAFEFVEDSHQKGYYVGSIPDSLLVAGNNFRLKVRTPAGKVYESDVERVLAIPAMDTIYYEIVVMPTTDPDVSYWGAQFYIDFKANDSYGNYYRFEIEETFEYHSQWPIQLYINENHERIDGSEDFSYYYCYKTDKLSQIFTLSTEGFTDNSYIKFPLHDVSNQTQRLAHNYSFLLKQYSLSKAASGFWNSIRMNSQESENLFGTQPAAIKGNITCTTDPEETVLGFFGVSSMIEKRITYLGGIDMPFSYMICEAMPVEILPSYRPLYLIYVETNGVKELAIQSTNCVICTERGGVLEKPWFFEE